MLRDVLVAGAGMSYFGKRPGVGVRAMAIEATDEALADSGIPVEHIERIYFGNAVGATIMHQDMVRGQAALRHSPLAHIPIVNVENACASSSTALMLAFEAVASGQADVVLAMGAEQLSHQDRDRTSKALRGAIDVEDAGEVDFTDNPGASVELMEGYAAEGRELMEVTGAELRDFGLVAVKNRNHATMNPRAHFRAPQTLQEVLGSRQVAEGLTLAMCSPITDGASALIVCSKEYAAKHGISGPKVLTSKIAPGTGKGSKPIQLAAKAAYEAAGLGIDDINIVEVHDAAAPAELLAYSDLGICAFGDAHLLVREGATALGGRLPVNMSGGLMSRGHPLAATGGAQIYELYTHLKARAGDRQVEGARIGLAANSGGWVGDAYAVGVVTILSNAH